MEAELDHPNEEIKRLQRCINDLVSVTALPAIFSGSEQLQIVRTLLDALFSMLQLDLVYVRLKGPAGEAPIEMVRTGQPRKLTSRPEEIVETLKRWLGDDPENWPPLVRSPIGNGDMSIVPVPLGLQREIGVIVAGTARADFPGQTERLILNVAANHAAIGLQEARRLSEQKQVARELDRRVAQRTAELAAANKALKKEIAERSLAEVRLRQEEAELKRSEARKAAILDSALDCVLTMGHDGCITEFNPAAERTFGYRRSEVVGKQLADIIIPPSLRDNHRRGLANYLSTGEARVLGRRLEMTATRADGSEFPVELTVTRIPLDGPPSFTGYLRDITERKKSEEKLRESELNLRQMTETIPEMLWSATPEGTIDYCNARVLDYTGLSAEEIMGTGWTKLLHPDDVDATAREWMSCVTTGTPYRVEVRTFYAADRSYRWCVTSALPLLDQNGRILKWHGTVVDMHDWKQAQEQLRNSQAELAHMTRVMTMGELTASIAHEVNQPLSGMITNASTCLRMLAAAPPNIDGALETARRTIRDGNRASDVITRLRALFTKKDTAPESVNLNEAAREVIALSRSELQRCGVILKTELVDGIPPVTGDRVQLQQVILNLLLNASEAMIGVNDRPRQLEVRTEIDEGDHVRLTVRDSGVGLDPQHMDKLFKAFYTTKSGGMGIGLSVSRSIIESHRGRLWATQNDGPGATFLFSIPRRIEGVTSEHTPGDNQRTGVPDSASNVRSS